MQITDNIKNLARQAVEELYSAHPPDSSWQVQETRKEIEGDYTLVCFPLARYSRKKPDETADEIGEFIVRNSDIFQSHTVVRGFLNLKLAEESWNEALTYLQTAPKNLDLGKGRKAMVEFSSPNTNKPLHLGHIRNILLGWSCSRIYKECGYEVIKTQIANDRGIAICKSMVAWELYGDGKTPESEQIKGDHFVGDYYVLFGQKVNEEYDQWQDTEEAKALFEQSDIEDKEVFFKKYKNEYFNKHSALGAKAKDYLLAWEADDPEVVALWKKLNDWVYQGFDKTYDALGVEFDKIYYESETYKLGKDIVEEGLEKGVFFRKEDSSVWVNLEDVGLDEKLVLRSDGTSVYMTQDLGTAEQRYADFKADEMIYVVGNEQNYHFKVLFEIIKKMERPYADGLFHLSYGMVDLPSGRMKTREGTVVDADDLIHEVYSEVVKNAEDKGGLEGLSEDERNAILTKIALGALKFFILKVNAQKHMVFNPSESVDLQGHTGPYIQNAYVRIKSILRKYMEDELPELDLRHYRANESETTLIKTLMSWPEHLRQAKEEYDPAVIAAFAYKLAKEFHRFYHESPILKAEKEAKNFRLALAKLVSEYLAYAMNILGIEMPNRM